MNSKKKFFLFVFFIVISISVAIFSGYIGISISNLESFVYKNHIYAIFIYNLLFITLTTFSFSVSAMTGLGALFFSWPELFVYSMIGIMGSSIIHYNIARKLGRDYVRNYIEKKGGKLKKFDKILEENTFKTIIILSAIVFVPPTIPNFLGGIIKIKFPL